MQMRFVKKYTNTVPMIRRNCSAWITPSIVRWKCVAMRSDEAAAQQEIRAGQVSGGADRGARRGVARALGEVVLALVARNPRHLDERIDRDEDDEDHQDDQRDEHTHRVHLAEDGEVQVRRREAQRTIREADVPVGLRTGRNGGGVIRPIAPDRVDLNKRRDQHECTEDDEEESTHLRHVHGHHRVADDVLIRAAGAGELRVLVHDHEHEVHRDECDHDERQDQDVRSVYRRPTIASPGNSPPNSMYEIQGPATGTAFTMPSMMRRPLPESTSSGSE